MCVYAYMCVCVCVCVCVKWSESHSVMSDSLRPMDCQACQTPLSMEFSRPDHWSGWPFPSPGDLPNPGIEPRSPSLQADSLSAEPQGKPKNTGVGSQPIPSPRDLPDPGIEPVSPALQADSSPTELWGKLRTYSNLKPKKKRDLEGECNYSGLENSMDCIVHGVTKNWTWLSNFHIYTLFIFAYFIYLNYSNFS